MTGNAKTIENEAIDAIADAELDAVTGGKFHYETMGGHSYAVGRDHWGNRLAVRVD